MQIQTDVIVMGAKKFQGTIEGNSFDTTTLFVQIDLDDSKGTAKGFATQEMRCGESAEYDKIKHLTFPFKAKATVEMVTTGKAQRVRVVDLKPESVVK